MHVGQEIIISPKVIRCGCGRFMNGDDKKINFQNMSKHRYFFVFVRIVWVSIFAGYTFFLMQNGAIFRGVILVCLRGCYFFEIFSLFKGKLGRKPLYFFQNRHLGFVMFHACIHQYCVAGGNMCKCLCYYVF